MQLFLVVMLENLWVGLKGKMFMIDRFKIKNKTLVIP